MQELVLRAANDHIQGRVQAQAGHRPSMRRNFNCQLLNICSEQSNMAGGEAADEHVVLVHEACAWVATPGECIYLQEGLTRIITEYGTTVIGDGQDALV